MNPQPRGAGLPGSTRDEDLVRALTASIVPTASQHFDGSDFLAAILTNDRPDWVDRVDRVLARFRGIDEASGYDAAQIDRILADGSGDPERDWFIDLIVVGCLADPAQWPMLSWRPDPPGGWPAVDLTSEHREARVGPESLKRRYDAIVIGSGAGGGVAAEALAADGRSVLVIEAGSWPETQAMTGDHLRNPRSSFGLEVFSGPPRLGHPRLLASTGKDIEIAPVDGGWSNNAFTLGGGTRVYGAQAWRLTPTDFAMQTTYGRPQGSSLVDWPIEYADLEPYYTKAEIQMGVSGRSAGDSSAGPRSRDYPMGPLPAGMGSAVLQRGADTLGWQTTTVPLLVNSAPYDGRAACVQCPQCVGFACPVGAKSGSQNTTLRRALATGNCAVMIEATAEQLVVDENGRVVAVAIVGRSGGEVWRRTVAAEEFVVAGGAIETARLLLNSAHPGEPGGLGNNTDQVGRHLQGHAYAGAIGIFADPVVDLVGPGPSIATCDFRHGNDSIVGGGMLANEFVPTPAASFTALRAARLLPSHGARLEDDLGELVPRILRVVGPIQEVTSDESRVTVVKSRRDRLGIPAARLSGALHREDLRAQAFLTAKAIQWLEASGAKARPDMVNRPTIGPSGGQHQAGTCRMGADPGSSVVDIQGRVWGHSNLRITDTSVHPTNGGVNPVLTAIAMAYRTMDYMVKKR